MPSVVGRRRVAASGFHGQAHHHQAEQDGDQWGVGALAEKEHAVIVERPENQVSGSAP
jgi:hypothetical protein